MQDKIQEIMGLVDAYGFAVIDVERARKAEKAIKALAIADSAYDAIQSKIRELVREPLSDAADDSCMLSFIQSECLDIRCVSHAEDSYGWEIIQHHMGTPSEVKVGESFNEDGLRSAIEDAIGTITN